MTVEQLEGLRDGKMYSKIELISSIINTLNAISAEKELERRKVVASMMFELSEPFDPMTDKDGADLCRPNPPEFEYARIIDDIRQLEGRIQEAKNEIELLY